MLDKINVLILKIPSFWFLHVSFVYKVSCNTQHPMESSYVPRKESDTAVVYHLPKISRNFGLEVSVLEEGQVLFTVIHPKFLDNLRRSA